MQSKLAYLLLFLSKNIMENTLKIEVRFIKEWQINRDFAITIIPECQEFLKKFKNREEQYEYLLKYFENQTMKKDFFNHIIIGTSLWMIEWTEDYEKIKKNDKLRNNNI